jgi:hypothetical protein
MAKVIFSPLVSSVSGKLGAAVFQGGPGGSMVRENTHRRPRMSAALQDSQRCLAEAARRWAALDVTTRTLWASIGRSYNPTATGPGLAFSLGRRAFIRYAVQFLHFGRTVPTSPTVWPFLDVSQAFLSWDPYFSNMFGWWNGVSGATFDYRVWLQACPAFPQWATRSPWLLAYDTATEPRQTAVPGSSPTMWGLLPSYFERFEQFGASSSWRLRFSGIDTLDRVFSFDDGIANLVFI